MDVEIVSILTRHKDRVQRCLFVRPISYCKFQSSPGTKTGCNVTLTGWRKPFSCFNPHPAQRPGATSVSSTGWPARYCFNPHPAQRPGATLTGWPSIRTVFLFQSSPGTKTGCNGAGPRPFNRKDRQTCPREPPISIRPWLFARAPEATSLSKNACPYVVFKDREPRRPVATAPCSREVSEDQWLI